MPLSQRCLAFLLCFVASPYDHKIFAGLCMRMEYHCPESFCPRLGSFHLSVAVCASAYAFFCAHRSSDMTLKTVVGRMNWSDPLQLCGPWSVLTVQKVVSRMAEPEASQIVSQIPDHKSVRFRFSLIFQQPQICIGLVSFHSTMGFLGGDRWWAYLVLHDTTLSVQDIVLFILDTTLLYWSESDVVPDLLLLVLPESFSMPAQSRTGQTRWVYILPHCSSHALHSFLICSASWFFLYAILLWCCRLNIVLVCAVSEKIANGHTVSHFRARRVTDAYIVVLEGETGQMRKSLYFQKRNKLSDTPVILLSKRKQAFWCINRLTSQREGRSSLIRKSSTQIISLPKRK